MSIRDASLVGLGAAVISIASPIAVPMPLGVPSTLQSFIIPLMGVLLGPRIGGLSALVYVLLGVVGLPVFAGGLSGPAVLLGPTGGFLASFPVMAFIAGFVPMPLPKAAGPRQHLTGWLHTWMLLTLAFCINFLAGSLQFTFVTNSTASQAFAASVLPFLPSGLIKMAAVGIIGRKLARNVRRLAQGAY